MVSSFLYIFTSIVFYPLVYLILVITLPQETEKWLLILFAFLFGITLDFFEGNIGMNSSALVFISFLKPYLQRLLIPKNSIDEKDKLNLRILGLQTFSVYSFFMILFHHTFLFLLEHFSSGDFLGLIIKIMLSSSITFMIILIFQLFTIRTKN